MRAKEKLEEETFAGIRLAREAIESCRWRLLRPKKEDPIGCKSCPSFKARSCTFRIFLNRRNDIAAWVAE